MTEDLIAEHPESEAGGLTFSVGEDGHIWGHDGDGYPVVGINPQIVERYDMFVRGGRCYYRVAEGVSDDGE